MGEYHINGGQKISGEIKIGGAKNAVLPILSAVVLNSGISIIHNCPKISDTIIAIEILEAIGCHMKFEADTIIVDSSCINSDNVPEHLVRKMRSSIIFLGAMLGRFKKVRIGYPGGWHSLLELLNKHKTVFAGRNSFQEFQGLVH